MRKVLFWAVLAVLASTVTIVFDIMHLGGVQAGPMWIALNGVTFGIAIASAVHEYRYYRNGVEDGSADEEASV